MQAGLFNIVISLAMLLAAIPALGVLTAGQWYFSTSGGGVQNRTWITVWLACAILLSLPFTAFSKNFFTGFTGLVLLLVIPTLIGLLALLLVHWRDVYDLWRERKLITSILLLTLLVVLVSTAVSEPTPIAYFLLTALAISTVWSLSSRLGVGVLAAAALLLSLVLVVDALGVLGSHYVFLDPRLKAAYTVLSGLAALLAVIVSALCLQRYLERREGDGNAFLYLLLAGLLWVSVAAVTFRHGALVNATSRASEDHLPFGTLAAGVIAGLLLALTGSSKARKAGSAFMILAPLLLAVSYSLGFRVNGQAITAAARRPARGGNRALSSRYRRVSERFGRPDPLLPDVYQWTTYRARPDVVLPVRSRFLPPGLRLLPALLRLSGRHPVLGAVLRDQGALFCRYASRRRVDLR